MAEVYRGVLAGERGTQRDVAIKRLRAELRDDPAAVELFVNEARLAVRMAHPNVVHALELTRDDDGYALVCEWLDCVSLAELRERFGPLPWRAVLYAGQSVCQALDYLHDLNGAGVVHRDVTPANVLVTSSGQVKLGDFGVAWCAVNQPLVDVQSAGTPGFAAPEQRGGALVDARADLFGLGASLAALANELPRPLAAVLERAGRVEPAERFESARAFEMALQEAAESLQTRIEPSAMRSWIDEHGGLPRRAAPPSIDGAVSSILGGAPQRRPTAPGGEITSLKERRRLAPVLVALLLIAVLAGALGWAISRSHRERQPSAAEPAVAVVQPPAGRPAETPSLPSPPPPNIERPAPALMSPARPRIARPPLEPPVNGTVYLNAVPWAAVTIDGNRIGNTPIRNLALAAGRHRVVLENSPQALQREVEIQVTGDESQVFLVDLRRGTVKKRLGP
jgi:serine/threonine-protein kinase